jgi:hypothetical protein
MKDDYIIEKYEERPDGSGYYRSVRGNGLPLALKLKIGAFIVLGLAAGTFLFLFFLTLFLYLFVPAIILLAVWNLIRRR